MTGPQQPLGFPDLAAAAGDSCGELQSRGLHFSERAAITLQRRFAVREVLPPLHDYIGELWVQFDAVSAPAEPLRKEEKIAVSAAYVQQPPARIPWTILCAGSFANGIFPASRSRS